MRTLPYLLAILVITSWVGCVKSDDDDDDPTPTGVLEKYTYKLGTDSGATFFNYDAAGKVRRIKWVYYDQSGEDSITTTITRDGSGNIIQIVEQEGTTQIPHQVSVTYQPGSSMLKSVVSKTVPVYKDSSVYSYSGAIITRNRYRENQQTGAYEFTDITEYTVMDGNLIKTRTYTVDPGGIVQQIGQDDYTYDTRKAPISLSFEEAHLLGIDEHWFKNNVTQIVYNDLQTPSFSETIGYTYTYNTLDKPTAAQMSIQPGSQTGSITYIYK